MAHDERRLEVLRAIVQDYVSTNDPVGSKALAERHDLGVSPATIRNDMAVLEEQGYITQPHTSAGRVPTDKGYRLFVDRLSAVKPLSVAERRAIERFLDGAVDLHDVLSRSVRLLAQLTRQVAVVQYPTLSRSAVRHLEVVQVAATRLMVVLITDTGRVEQRVVDCPVDVDAEAVAELRSLLNAAFYGVKLIEAGRRCPACSTPRLRTCGGWWPASAPPSWRRWWSPARTGWSSAARPTSPAATHSISRARCVRCWRPWKNRSWSCG